MTPPDRTAAAFEQELADMLSEAVSGSHSVTQAKSFVARVWGAATTIATTATDQRAAEHWKAAYDTTTTELAALRERVRELEAVVAMVNKWSFSLGNVPLEVEMIKAARAAFEGAQEEW